MTRRPFTSRRRLDECTSFGCFVRHGASLESLNSYGGTVLDGTVWFALNGPIAGIDYVAIVRELLELGARTDVYPEMKRT